MTAPKTDWQSNDIMMLGEFREFFDEDKIGVIRSHLIPRITFEIYGTPRTLRRYTPTYWAVYFDGKYIGGIQDWHNDHQDIFWSNEPMRSERAARGLSCDGVKDVYCFDEYDWADGCYDAFYPSFATLQGLIDDYLTRRVNDPDAKQSHRIE